MKLARLREEKFKIINQGMGNRKGPQRIWNRDCTCNFFKYVKGTQWNPFTKTTISVEVVSMLAITNVPKTFIVKSVNFPFRFINLLLVLSDGLPNFSVLVPTISKFRKYTCVCVCVLQFLPYPIDYSFSL